MLLGLTDVNEGKIDVGGFDPMRDPLEVKRRIGYLPDSVGFYDNLTAQQNLRFTGRLAGFPRAAARQAHRRRRWSGSASRRSATTASGRTRAA